MKNITVEDIKMIQKFVREHNGVVSEEIGKGSEEIDVYDLVNTLLDVSVDFLGKAEPGLQADSFLGPSTRYSFDK